jgi:hypothetical protein
MFAVHSAREVAKDGVPLFRAIRDHAKWLQHDEDGDIGTTPASTMACLACKCSLHRVLCPSGFYLHQSVRYPYYWCEDAITTVLALSIFLMGVHGLYQDATAGHKWWTADFWCAPIPEADEKDEHSKHDSKTDYGSNNEATPLVKP